MKFLLNSGISNINTHGLRKIEKLFLSDYFSHFTNIMTKYHTKDSFIFLLLYLTNDWDDFEDYEFSTKFRDKTRGDMRK